MTHGRHAIVLAAGAASRFGGGKLTAAWRGEPLIRWPVRAALATRCESVILVVGADAGAVREAVRDLADTRLRIVEATNWALGMSASLKTGLTALPADAAAVAVFLGDMPLVETDVADAVLDRVMSGAPAARPLSPFGPAHPIAFGSRIFPDLMDLVGDQGGRPVLDALGAAVATVPVQGRGSVYDIDRPGDLLSDNP